MRVLDWKKVMKVGILNCRNNQSVKVVKAELVLCHEHEKKATVQSCSPRPSLNEEKLC
jgi:hypothetical protein